MIDENERMEVFLALNLRNKLLYANRLSYLEIYQTNVIPFTTSVLWVCDVELARTNFHPFDVFQYYVCKLLLRCQINKRKLLFLEKLITLPLNYTPKRPFTRRLHSFFVKSESKGYVFKILNQYILAPIFIG